jgi:hypothetical protein
VDATTPFYIGPGLIRDADGRIHIRLAKTADMRAAEARYGPLSLGPVTAGDGRTKATFRLESSRGRVDLLLEHDPVPDCLASVALVPTRIEPPDLD